MALKKLKKYPKKPKKTASSVVKENYLKKCKDIDKLNVPIKKENKKIEALDKKISGLKQK